MTRLRDKVPSLPVSQILRDSDRQMNGGGIKLLFKKLGGEDQTRTVLNIFWDLKQTNRVGSNVLQAVAQHMDKNDIRAVLSNYAYTQESDWFKRIPPAVKAQWAKELNSGWFGASSLDGAMIKALQAAAKHG